MNRLQSPIFYTAFASGKKRRSVFACPSDSGQATKRRRKEELANVGSRKKIIEDRDVWFSYKKVKVAIDSLFSYKKRLKD